MSDDLELFHFRFSPYNEKIRWALDFKGLKHKRTHLLPGPHASVTKKLSGQSATPILRIGAEAVAGSAKIIERLEVMRPDPSLYPTDQAMRREALEIERRFDFDLMPRIRRAILMSIASDGFYVSRMFGGGWFYGAMFPLVRPLVKKGNGITGPESVADGEQAAQEAFDWVAGRSNGTGYLAGERFSVADLAVASHLATCIDPPHPDMARPQPAPGPMKAWLERWRAHPGARYVQAMYSKHRPLPLG